MKTFNEAIKTCGNITVNIPKDLKVKIENWNKENTFYGVVNVVGDSMTCKENNSIPNRSKIFVSELVGFSDNLYTTNKVLLMPINKPLAILLVNKNGKEQMICKTISFIDCVNNTLCLRSYNENYNDVIIPFSMVKRVFEIHQVYKNDSVVLN